MKVKIKDIPSGVMFRSLHLRETNIYHTFMLDGGYTLQTTKYVNVKDLTNGKYYYWDVDIEVDTIQCDLMEPALVLLQVF